MGKQMRNKRNGLRKMKEAAQKYMKIVLGAYLLLMIAAFPFYAPQGYVEIGISKYKFFRMSGMIFAALICPAVFMLLIYWIKAKEKVKLSWTDKAVFFYGLAVLISYLFCEWKQEALWGTEGWYMGLMSQLMFVMIYFTVSRFSESIKSWYGVFLAVSSIIFLLGFLNRFSIYPIEMEGSSPVFISMLGNINWFCSYWMVVFPIGIVLYWTGSEKVFWKKAALISYILLGNMTGIVQGSSSGFLALGVVFLALFFLSFENNEALLRWIELGILFAVSLLAVSVIQIAFPRNLNYENVIEAGLTKPVVAFSTFIVMLCLYAIAYVGLKKREHSVESILWMKKTIAGILFAVILTVGILAIYFNFFGTTEETSRIAEIFTLDDEWGNYRGATWRAGLEAFAAMPVFNKIVGVGTDCFYLFAYNNWQIAERLYHVFGDARLTNAHNEWLTVLVNSGILGFFSYAAIFLSAIFQQVKAGKKQKMILVSAVCILSYTAHNMVSFQQVICTPAVFILLGFGEKLLREAGT